MQFVIGLGICVFSLCMAIIYNSEFIGYLLALLLILPWGYYAEASLDNLSEFLVGIMFD
jgi:hypothetical protein